MSSKIVRIIDLNKWAQDLHDQLSSEAMNADLLYAECRGLSDKGLPCDTQQAAYEKAEVVKGSIYKVRNHVLEELERLSS